MPILSASEVIKSFRNFEKAHKLQPVYAISITGDPNLSEEEKDLYNMFVTKPFDKAQVRDAITTQ